MTIQERVTDLVSRMTLEEKVSQMVFDAPAIERLGIPAYNWWNECLHGVGRAGLATVFPQAIGLAATWNLDLMHRIATAISDEARAKHHEALRRGMRRIYSGLTFWSPNVNIFRDPRWGRGQETYGEDPYLMASMGVAFVQGLQGDHPHYLKLIATPKHFAVHSGPESNRHHFDAQVDERDLRQTYLPAFEACVKEGRATSVMGAYNRTNGEPCCASPTLLQKILREEWGFGGPSGTEGYVVSDCEAIRDIYERHQVVETAAEATALAVKHGCDLNCGSAYPALLEAVEQGLISEDVIDQAVTRLFTARFRLGMFDAPEQVPYTQIPYEIINSPEHQALALQAARESIVLLKNKNDLLPLGKDIESIAVVGPNADDLQVLLGNYSGTPARAITPLQGIRKKISPSTKLYYAQGCEITSGIPPLKPVPAESLHPVDANEGQRGLTAVYFDNADWQGEPALRRIDRLVDFYWKDTTPLGGQWGDRFAARWTGFLVPPASGAYRLGVNGCSEYKLYLDGALFAAHQNVHHSILKTQEVELEAGRFYRLQLDFASRGFDPQVQLLWAPLQMDHTDQALEVAEKASIVVAVMGLSPSVEGEEMPVKAKGFDRGDRTAIGLPQSQVELLRRLYALGKPLVLVLLNGSALAVPWAAEHVPAIVEAWYPGQAGGDALADVLFGDYNPGGRLPVTFYESMEDLPPFEDYQMEGRTYRYFRGKPLFPFGHGLSYTTFEFGNLQMERIKVQAGDSVSISVDVSNTGDRAGDEVVQLYVRHHDTSVPHPIKEVKGFRRVTLQPGECKTVIFTLHTHQLGYYDETIRYVVRPGLVEVMVGSSSQDLPLAGTLEIIGEQIEVGAGKVFFSQVREVKG
jgi:beta-glucosidase